MLRHFSLIVALLFFAAGIAAAEDAYFDIDLAKTKITKGQIPERKHPRNWRLAQAIQPYVRVEGGEGYLVDPLRMQWSDRPQRADRVRIRAEAGKDVTATAYIFNEDYSALVPVSFTIPSSAADPDARDPFLRAKLNYHRDLLDHDVPGAAWFRHQANEAAAALGQKALDERGQPFRPRRNDMEDTFSLFTGDRAMSENLQLDRALRVVQPSADASVQLSKIKGIDIREMNWAPLVKDLKPELDPAASIIPADQHAIFFPSFAAFTAVGDEAERDSIPILSLLSPRSEDARTKEKYQRQLCLPLTTLGRLLGPQLIKSMTLTGSDPYLRIGSDVAVIFEPKDPAALYTMLVTQIGLSTRGRNDVKQAKLDGPLYSCLQTISPDRSVCSYLAQIGDFIVVSNSRQQLDRLARTKKGDSPSLASQNEYIFFRDRYKRGDADESAFVILTDVTIRRWCGPKWRIADSRRTRALAAMTAEQARHMNELVKGDVQPVQIQSSFLDVGRLDLTSSGISSSAFGTLDFMTPIIEMNFDKVTREEADAYNRWRDSYQQNWSQFFDPIAIRLVTRPDKLAADVTVMPLIARSEYAEVIELTRGAKINDAATDRHDALLHIALALNKNSRPMRELGNLGNILGGNVRIDVLGWMGQTASLYFDDDPAWAALAKLKDGPESFSTLLGAKLPVALRVEVVNPFKLTLFLTAIRVFVEGAAPGTVTWEALKHGEQAYVKISPTEKGRRDIGDVPEEFAIYYAAMPDALVISMNEDVIKRAIDRRAARLAGKDAAPAAHPWQASNFVAQGDRRIFEIAGPLLAREYQREMQIRAWGNIPILNEWKRMYPEQDPIKLHERLWQITLTCPGGGSYAWNEQFQTMESTIYGHPGAPKPGPALPAMLNELLFGNFGVDLENDGLRARAILDRKK